MGAVAVASTVLPSPGGAAGTQYSDVQAGGPPDQSSKPNVPAPEGGSTEPGGNGGPEGGNVPPDTSRPGGGNQDPGQTQPGEPGAGNGQGGGETGSGTGDGSTGNGQGNGNGGSNGNGGGKGNGNSGGSSGSAGGSSDTLSPTEKAEADVLALVNDEREDAGCKPVKASKQLAELAGDFSRSMAIEGFFSHLGPDGSSPWDRAEDLGILDLGGENIARGQESAEDVVDDWMRSPSHRANILNCEYRTMGVGEYVDEDGPWWTQDFGY
ncbi:CAP domain-containing protein [Streptomyces bathyalis]|uniref:CAP domain-containing protein n=2 Tax=Streptomyces bathyalis TaxID=2710756 RepID=A0A7T1WTQ8_9ACTN|nr:CAP domain-containing protein [Streptomyces bathyalis]